MSSSYAESFDAMLACLDELASADPIYRTAGEKQAALLGYSAVIAKAEAGRARVLAAAEDVAEATGARSAAQWLADATHDVPGTLHRHTRLGAALDARWTELQSAFTAGEINLPQTRIMVDALERLPRTLGDDLRDKAERFLLAQGSPLPLRELRTLGDRLLDHLAPEIADEAEYRRLLADERRAAAEACLTFHKRGDGTTDIRARVSNHVAGRLGVILDAYTTPRRHQDDRRGSGGLTGPDDEFLNLPIHRRRGIGFIWFLESILGQDLPRHGATATTLTVTVSYADLVSDVGVATTSTGERVTVDTARRLACQAGILPVVLGGSSEVLDVGRTRRLITNAIRRALNLRDGRCTANGCTMPASYCEGHHVIPWSQGGSTSLENSKLLCSFHHHRAHDPGWTTTHHPSGKTTFARRQ